MIYLDHNATTPVDPEVFEAMLPWLNGSHFGNPSSIYKMGREARKALEDAREEIAVLLGAKGHEILFTSGATESNNWVIFGRAPNGNAGRFITSAVEHSSILKSAKVLEEAGHSVEYMPVDSACLVSGDALRKSLSSGPTPFLVSIQAVNQVAGSIQPIPAFADLAHAANTLFHCDAVQAAGKIPVNVGEWKVDFLTLAGHKIYGPRGIGILYVRSGAELGRFIQGGPQERNRRPGTENVAGAVGIAKALTLVTKHREEWMKRILGLRDALAKGIVEKIPGARINTDVQKSVPSTLSVSFEGVENETLLIQMDMKGIAASSGSACASGSIEPCSVLLAMGRNRLEATSGIRFTLGKRTLESDIRQVLEILPPLVENSRKT